MIKEINGKSYLSDYRLGDMKLPYIQGRLKDLNEWYLKSIGLGDLLGSFVIDNFTSEEREKLIVVEYNGTNGKMYALGTVQWENKHNLWMEIKLYDD